MKLGDNISAPKFPGARREGNALGGTPLSEDCSGGFSLALSTAISSVAVSTVADNECSVSSSELIRSPAPPVLSRFVLVMINQCG